MKKKHDWYVGTWDLRVVRPDGTVREEFLNLRNGLADDGEFVMLSNFFRNSYSSIGPFNVRLCNEVLTVASHYEAGVSPVEINAAGVTGTYPVAITRDENATTGWPTLELDTDGNWRISAAAFSMVATGPGIGPFSTLFLTASVTWAGTPPEGHASPEEVLLAFLTVPTRTIVSGDTLNITARVKLQ